MKELTHPNFKDVYIEVVSEPIFLKDHVKLNMRYMSIYNYPLSGKYTWQAIPIKAFKELIPYESKRKNT